MSRITLETLVDTEFGKMEMKEVLRLSEFFPIPNEYYQMLMQDAKEYLEQISGLEIHSIKLGSDGWGSRTPIAVIEYKNELMKLTWSGWNKGFMKESPHGGRFSYNF